MPGFETLSRNDRQAVELFAQHVEYRVDRGVVNVPLYLQLTRQQVVESTIVARDRFAAGVDSQADLDRKVARNDAKLAELDRIELGVAELAVDAAGRIVEAAFAGGKLTAHGVLVRRRWLADAREVSDTDPAQLVAWAVQGLAEAVEVLS